MRIFLDSAYSFLSVISVNNQQKETILAVPVFYCNLAIDMLI